MIALTALNVKNRDRLYTWPGSVLWDTQKNTWYCLPAIYVFTELKIQEFCYFLSGVDTKQP